MTLPEDFTRYTQSLMGEQLFARLSQALTEEPPVSIRINPFKTCGLPTGAGRVPWCADGVYLPVRPAFTFDPLMHAGAYYVQEAASMFVDRVLRQHVDGPVLMLDMCAAPGGKSTAARAALPEGSVLVANEPMAQRANILSENIQKFGHPDVIVTNNFPADYRKAGVTFDVVLTDVPCSGEGMFRKDAGAIGEWSTQNVESCQRLQREIVADAWQCLRPGGLLIYSTCTFNAHEDEENALWIAEELGGEPLTADTDGAWGITGSLVVGVDLPVYRFIPGRTRGEGLFMCAFRKPGEYTETKKKEKRRERKGAKAQPVPKVDRSWLNAPDDFETTVCGDKIVAIPRRWADFYRQMQGLRILHAGVTLGQAKGRDIQPSQSLALSTALNPTAFPTVALDRQQALCYLRKEAVTLPADTPRGHVIVTHQGFPLGFVKNIGNRANNLYPAEWKIRSTHIAEPDGLPDVRPLHPIG